MEWSTISIKTWLHSKNQKAIETYRWSKIRKNGINKQDKLALAKIFKRWKIIGRIVRVIIGKLRELIVEGKITKLYSKKLKLIAQAIDV